MVMEVFSISGEILSLIGDFYHDFDYLRNGLQDTIDNIDKTVNFETNPESVKWRKLDKYELLIVAKGGRIDPENSDRIWINDKQDRAIEKFVKNGGGLLALHSALAGYPMDSSFRDVLRGNFLSHPREHPEVAFEVLDENHPLTAGVHSFSVVDEQYFVEVDEEDTEIFLRGASEEHGGSPAGWAHGFGRGKVCCLTPGHNEEVLTNPMMKRLLQNAIKWL